MGRLFGGDRGTATPFFTTPFAGLSLEGLAKLARATRLGGVSLMHLALRPIILAPERSYAVRGQRDEATHSEANGIDCGASRLRRWTLPEGAARARASAP